LSWHDQTVAKSLLYPVKRFDAVAVLRAGVVDSDPDLVSELQAEPRPIVVPESRRRPQVEAGLHAGVRPVGVLAAGAATGRERPLDLTGGDGDPMAGSELVHGSTVPAAQQQPRDLGSYAVRALPVVLLHGLATSSRRTWRETGWIDLLEDAGRDVVAPDLPGHGGAPAALDLEAATEAHLPPGPCDAVGFSLGARVLLGMAAAHPNRFNRLVVAGVGANLFRLDPEHARMIRCALAGDVDPDNPVAHHFAALADNPDVDNEAVVALLDQPRSPLAAEDLARIDLPVLVVLGDQDFAGPADPLVEALPDARLVTLSGVDHFATPKDFGFLDAALDFLGAVPR